MRQYISVIFLFIFTFLLFNSSFSQDSVNRKWERKRIDAQLVTLDDDNYLGQILAVDEHQLYFLLGSDEIQRWDIESTYFSSR